MFAIAIFLYITVILDEEFPRKTFTMNQTGPGVEKCHLDDLSELGFSSEPHLPHPPPEYGRNALGISEVKQN